MIAPGELDAAALQLLAAFALLCVRVAPLAWLAPWAGLRRMPLPLALALTLVLALCLWPAAQPLPALPLALWPLLALALREAAIGLVYALALSLPLLAFEWSGQFIGRFAGASERDAADTAYARLQLFVAVAAFFALGGHRIALAALAESVAAQPLGAFSLSPDVSAIALGGVRLVAEAYGFALLLALPVAAALVLAELTLALAARAAWASALTLAAAPLRAGLALLVVWIGVAFGLAALPRALERGLAAAARLLDLL